MEDTEKQELIAKIMNEVKEPVLRDKLLRELTSSNNQGVRRDNRDYVSLNFIAHPWAISNKNPLFLAGFDFLGLFGFSSGGSCGI